MFRIPGVGVNRRIGFRGIGGGALLLATPQSILGADYVDGWLGEDATATDWPSITGAFPLSVLSGTPVPDADHFGAQDRARVELTADYYVSDAAGLGDLLSSATALPFTLIVVAQPTTTTANRVLCGWGSTAGGTAGPYVQLWTRSPNGYALRFHRVNNTNVDVEPALAGYGIDTRERAWIITYAGAGGALKVRVRDYSRLASQPGWQTLYSATPADPSSLLGIDRFIVGSCLQGSGTPASAVQGNHAEYHVGRAMLTDPKIAQVEAYLDARFADRTAHILTSRTQIIGPATATHGSVGDPGGDGSNIMFGTIVRAASWHASPLDTYYCLFGHHDGTYIRLAHAPAVTGPWTVVPTGTTATLAALNAAGGYSLGTHLSSPHLVVDMVNEIYVLFAHADSTGLGHETVVATSTDLVTWTFNDSGAALASPAVGMTYVRPFSYGGVWYAVSNFLELFRSSDVAGIAGASYARQATLTTFRGPNPGSARHAAALVRGSTLVVFWSESDDYPEHLRYASLDLATAGSWETWALGASSSLILPYTDGDGADLPFVEAVAGVAHARTRGLRDPGFFEDDDGTIWLIYAQAGEDALAVVDVTAWLDTNFPE